MLGFKEGRSAVEGVKVQLIALGFTVFASFSVQANSDAPLRIGISGFALPEHREQIVEATENALRPVFGTRLMARHYSVQDLEEAVKDAEVDIILSSSGLARRVVPYGVRPLVTITSPGLEDPNHNEGSVVVVRRDSPYRKLEDLEGASVSANLPWGFSGWLIAQGEIAGHGYNPDKFFGEKLFVGRSNAMEEIVANVVGGRSDVGILRLCALETMEQKNPSLKDALRVINERPQKAAACRTSTELYPAQTLSVTPRVDSKIARDMTMHLLEMKPTPTGHSWSIASDFQHVDELLKTLRIGPYEYLRQWSLKRFLTVAWPWLMLLACGVAGLFWHSRRTDRLLRQKEALLGRMFEQEAEQSRRLAFLQRSNTVNLISSMVAHELRQPLAALTFYADGIDMMLEKGRLDNEKLRKFSSGISREANRASEILTTVRSYAKNRDQQRAIQDVEQLINDAIELFQSGQTHKVAVRKVVCGSPLMVKGNALELTLVFVNLLKNAREASDNPAIAIECCKADSATERIEISVYDNGERISDERLSSLGQPLFSDKPNGLGLGLSIAKTIVEAHGGNIAFEHSRRTDYPGLQVIVTLPPATKSKD